MGSGRSVAGLERFALAATEALATECAVFKPQSAFFERYGSRGIAVLERVIATLREAGALVLLDVKRGDIGSTIQAYADAYLDPASPIAADAITVSPYLGFGSLDPFVDAARSTAPGCSCWPSPPTRRARGPARPHRRGPTVTGTVLDHLRGLNAGAEPLGTFGAVVGATMGETGVDFDVQRPAALARATAPREARRPTWPGSSARPCPPCCPARPAS